MKCILKIPGDGTGHNGKPKYDREGPVEKFLVDNTRFYNFVLKHVRTCDKCDATEILKFYLARRIKREDQMTSTGLVLLALKYKKIDPKIPDSLVREFMWRNGLDSHYEHRAILPLYELAKAVRLSCLSNQTAMNAPYPIPDWAVKDAPDRQLLLSLADIVKNKPLEFVLALGPNDDSELAHLVTVAGVMRE